MELIEYTRLFRKWLWLILIAAFVAGGITFVIRRSQPSVYEAQTTIAIGSFIQSPNPNSSEIQTGVQLAQTYAELAKTYSVLQPAIDKLNLPLSYEEIQAIVDVRILPQTSLLVLSVNYTDPVLAADIANEVAQQLILNSPTNLTVEQQSQIDLANDQITRLNEQLISERQELELVNLQLAGTTDPAEIERLTNQRNALIDHTNQASATIAQFSTTIANLQERTNSVDLVEPARVPTNPSGSSLLTTTLLGAIVGVALICGVILLMEYLDDTMRTTEEAAQALGLPVLGGIIRFGKPKDTYQQRLISQLPLMISEVSEGYRAVRTNLLFSAEHEQNKVYLVTSPGPEEGKSLTSSNLAISMALTGLQVLLIDCDLRRPKLHEVFGLNNVVGLTTLLLASQDKNLDSLANNGDMPVNFSQCLQNTNVPNLRVITSGFIPQNPTELLGSALMQHWIEIFKSSSNVDVILVDTPPCLMLSDSIVLAASSGANIVLVIEAGHTQRAAALKAKEQFNQVGGKIKGVVLNGVNVRDEKYYGYGYGYGYGYYNQSPSERTLRPESQENGKRERE